MAKPDYKQLVEAIEGDFKVAQDALEGAKQADELIKKTEDAETRKELVSLKEKFLQISDKASTNATTTQSVGQSFIRSRST
jgi:hypothetical protein